jgi:hypothetical protein
MADYKLVVMSNPLEGKEAEFNDWYDTRHLDDVLNVPGFHRAQRLTTEAVIPGPPPAFRYVAIYDFVSDDIEKTMGYFLSIAGGEKMPIPPLMEPGAAMYVCKAGTAIVRDTPTPWPV